MRSHTRRHFGARLVFGCAFVAVVASALPVQAQKGGSREEDMLLGEIPSVFGASRFDQSVTEAPASVTVILSREIEAHGWRTLAELLATVRGFYVSDDRSYTYLGSRGFARPGDYNTRILLLIDGVRVNEPVFDGAYVGTESLVDLDDVERVEVIRGPASSLYGTNALFAIVNVVALPGRLRRGLSARASVERFRTGDVAIAGGTRLRSGLSLSGSAGAWRSGGRDFHFPEFDAPETNHGIAAGKDDGRRDHLFGKAEWGALTLEGAFVDRRKTVPTAPFETEFNDGRMYVRDRLQMLSVAYRRPMGERSELSVTGSAHRYDYDSKFPYGAGLTLDAAQARWGIADMQYSRRLRAGHRLIVGAMYQHNARVEQSNRAVDNPESDFFDDTAEDNWALYALGEFRLGKRLILNSGIRRDAAVSRRAEVNPRAALIFKLGEGSAVKALYGRAFRSPNPYERFYNDGGVTQKANPALAREQVSTYELLVEKLFNRHVRGSTSAYRYETRDLIDLTVDESDGLQQFRNIGRAMGEGIETEVELDFGELTGRLSYALQRTWDPTTDARLTNSPMHLAMASIVAPLVPGRVRGAFELRAMSARLSQETHRVPGHLVANVVLTSRRPMYGAHAALGLYNLGNAHYADPVGAEVRMTSISRDPRSVRLTVTWTR